MMRLTLHHFLYHGNFSQKNHHIPVCVPHPSLSNGHLPYFAGGLPLHSNLFALCRGSSKKTRTF